MIQLECSNCKTMLSIDDAFAGGVCRCQYCGTIQTVPRPSSAAAQTADVGSPKALFRRKARIESALSPYNDDLDRAADQMESSGALSPNAFSALSGSSKRSSSPASPGDSAAGSSPAGRSQAEAPSSRRTAATSTATAAAGATLSQPSATAAGQPHFVPKPSSSTVASPIGASSRTPLIIAAAVVGVLVCGGGLWFALSGDSEPDPTPTAPQVAPAPEAKPAPAAKLDPAPEPKAMPARVVNRDPSPAPVVVVEPAPAQVPSGEPGSFAGISLGGASVVYILDRGGRTNDEFQQILDACYKSVESLGQQRKFALILWNEGQDLAFPQEDLATASATNLDACRKLIINTNVGFSDIDPVLAKALAKKPEDIVLVSAMDMDDLTATTIRDQLAKAGAPVRFHGIAVGTELTTERLRALAADHGGQFKQVEAAALK